MKFPLFLILLLVGATRYIQAQPIAACLNEINKLEAISIIGVGESCHGTHELNQLRRELIESLIVSNEVKLIGIEERPQVIDLINRPLNSLSNDTIKKIIVDNALWVNKNEELFKLIQFVKNYNRNTTKKPIYFYGITGYYTIELLVNKFPELHESSARHKAVIGLLTDTLKSRNERSALLEIELDKIKNYAAPKDSIWYYYDLFNLVQGSIYTLMTDRAARYKFNDISMFRNIQYLNLHYNISPMSKMIIWAHNTHIAKEDKGIKRLGSFLNAAYKQKYFALLTDFKQGKFTAYSPEKQEDNTYNYQPKTFYKKCKKRKETGLVLDRCLPLKLNDIGAQYHYEGKLSYQKKVRLGKHADAVLIIDSIQPTHLLEGAKLNAW